MESMVLSLPSQESDWVERKTSIGLFELGERPFNIENNKKKVLRPDQILKYLLCFL